MKIKTLFALIMVLALTAYANITGKVDLSGAGVVKSSDVKVGFNSISYGVDKDGNYSIGTGVSVKGGIRIPQKALVGAYDVTGRKINLNHLWSQEMSSFKTYSNVGGVAARSYSISDTLYIVVNGDTLREVPVTSWDTVLPPNYIVQRNVGVTVSDYQNMVQVVWWNSDSIAHVLDLGHASTDPSKFSGYIYTAYSDADFKVNAHLYNLFVRTRTVDSIKSYTQVLDVKAKVGDLTFSPSDFKENTYYSTAGYSLTPNDSSISNYTEKSISMVYVTDRDTLDSTLVLDSSSFVKFVRDTAKNDSGFSGVIRISNTRINPSVHAVSVDTSISILFTSATLTGIATKASPRILVERGESWTWTIADSVSNVSIGDSLSFDITSLVKSYPDYVIDNGFVSDVKIKYTWKIVKIHSYWK